MSQAAPAISHPAVKPVSVYNIANALTLLRLVVVPVFAVVLLAQEGANTTLRWWAAGLFIAAAFTDLLDGDLARRRGLITDVGKVADPIADKALTGAAFVGLSLLGVVPWWVSAVVIAREAAVTLLRLWVLRYGVIAASRGGKAKTLLQSLGLGLLIMPLSGWWSTVAMVVLAVAVVVTVVTGLDYIRRAITLRRSVLARGTASDLAAAQAFGAAGADLQVSEPAHRR